MLMVVGHGAVVVELNEIQVRVSVTINCCVSLDPFLGNLSLETIQRIRFKASCRWKQLKLVPNLNSARRFGMCVVMSSCLTQPSTSASFASSQAAHHGGNTAAAHC
jgi:hypothetical protein